jgi:hypothetical protein
MSNTNRSKDGFIFTGTAFLLVLPALLLAASFINMLELGAQGVSNAVHGDVLLYAYDSMSSSFNRSSHDLVSKYGNDENEIQDVLNNVWKPAMEGNFSQELGVNISIGAIYAVDDNGMIKISGSATNTSGKIWVNITSMDGELSLTRGMRALWIAY